MSWMKLATAALGVATIILTQMFVPDGATGHDMLVGLGSGLVMWTVKWVGTAEVSLTGGK